MEAQQGAEVIAAEERLSDVQRVIAAKQVQKSRLLDFYISGGFTKAELDQARRRLDAALEALEQERGDLGRHLKARKATAAELQSLKDHMALIRAGLEEADNDFETRRSIIEMLDVRATLDGSSGETIVMARCHLGESQLPVASTTPRTCCEGS